MSDVKVDRRAADVAHAESVTGREEPQACRRLLCLFSQIGQCGAKTVQWGTARQDPLGSDALLGPLGGSSPASHEIPDQGEVAGVIEVAAVLERPVQAPGRRGRHPTAGGKLGG